MASPLFEQAMSAVQSGDLESAKNLFVRVIEFSSDKAEIESAKEHLRKVGAGELILPDPNPEPQVTLTTAPTLEGFRVVQTIDIVTAEAVMGMNIFRDAMAQVRNIVGGRSTTTQKALREARDTCLRELKNEAAGLGANAVIAMKLDYAEFTGGGSGMLFLVASGTAVVVEQA